MRRLFPSPSDSPNSAMHPAHWCTSGILLPHFPCGSVPPLKILAQTLLPQREFLWPINLIDPVHPVCDHLGTLYNRYQDFILCICLHAILKSVLCFDRVLEFRDHACPVYSCILSTQCPPPTPAIPDKYCWVNERSLSVLTHNGGNVSQGDWSHR